MSEKVGSDEEMVGSVAGTYHLLPALDELSIRAGRDHVISRQRRVEAARDPRMLILATMLMLNALCVLARGLL